MTKEDFYGRAEEYNVASDPLQLAPGGPRVVNITGGVEAVTINVKLPDATELMTGGPHFCILQGTGDAKQVQIKDCAGNDLALLDLSSDRGALCWLANGDSQAGVWVIFVGQTTL